MRACLALAVAVAVAVALTAGCGTEPGPAEWVAPSPAPSPPASSSTPWAWPSALAWRWPSPSAPAVPSRSSARPTTTRSSPRVSDGWEITVYYTAVEEFHDDETTDVTGCPKLACSHGSDDLGRYPAGFVQAVQDEGTGRTASGQYLNWSYDVGFWLDSAPRDTNGRRLVPFVSAAADPDVLPQGTRFTIAACGHQDDGSTPPAATCTALRRAAWEITDEFTPGLGGNRHIDAYIGPETGPGFTDSDWYLTLTGARLTLS